MIQLLRNLVPSNVLTLLITETVLIFSCFVAACALILQVDPMVYLLWDGGITRIAIVVATIVMALYFHDLYAEIRVRAKLLLFQQVLQAIGIAFLIQALLLYSRQELDLPLRVMITGSGLSLLAVSAWRLLYDAVVLRALGEQRIVFLGDNDLVEDIAAYLGGHHELGMRAVGYIEEANSPVLEDRGVARLGAPEELRPLVGQARPDLIIVGLRERRGRSPMAELLELRFSGIRIQEATAAYESMFHRVPLKNLRPAQLIYSGELGPRPGMVALQAAYSRLLALFGLLLACPVMALVALLIKLSSRGPVLFRQTRMGWQGKLFTLYKFRSMYADAEAATGAVWAARDDPRITPAGRWLRRLRLDELPQFLNVLRGDMSIVGPRPERPEFVATLAEEIPFYRQRLCVRPGVTGWAQINHKYGDTVDDAARKLEFDLYYIKNLSPSLDAYIIFHTLKTMLLSRGAQ
jgi:exopolysaccharide biosynthesis polyprenyl glycosylphosphotransferase